MYCVSSSIGAVAAGDIDERLDVNSSSWTWREKNINIILKKQFINMVGTGSVKSKTDLAQIFSVAYYLRLISIF